MITLKSLRSLNQSKQPLPSPVIFVFASPPSSINSNPATSTATFKPSPRKETNTGLEGETFKRENISRHIYVY
ncbi:hypothetical protein HanRHA438_Chr09g0373361 [Helianthus annuus]|uniref:Uncharacterized protein n=1 Tax=Helianthus annuus TaxID=4232 RepID=A0A251TQL9_HELAN|nr:hypothetical protein HanXRQr2_Chr09g0361921 [Helianthus annuus]KAJ0885910.1 hypothetical protein HanRHA438_Chr09g0373361 [Helianthus annuus]KAJ0891063.1 hypothetical protein HanPSC8_Chr09g0349211 [Helianthus annuus]